MKNKKRNFEARFWSGTGKHSAVGLLESFFQFHDLAVVKETLNQMVQCSVQKNIRTVKEPADIFHLYQSLRSLVRAARLIGKKVKKVKFRVSRESHLLTPLMSLSAEEYQNPARVLRKAFKACSPEAYDDFLSAVVYLSLGDQRCEEERKIIIPYIQLLKMLDAAWLIAERAATEK